ncbi:MAG TPA: leucine--tRNA ligase [Candidatus Acidoferrum sp.]|nr:leucine--tRNA ligase [Candidatus Acidoferrum sp.]
MIDYKEMEARWQKAWSEAKVYEPEPNEREGLLVTFAFPYVNSPPHTGHMKTYSLTDSYARYMRMKGYNVLLPTGFHYSGIPILGMAKRLAKKDPELIEDFSKIYQVPSQEIEKMGDPLYLANYFTEEYVLAFNEVGLGIDWRRRFNTVEKHFSKLVEWQFFKLKEKGLLTQGTHPVGWCTNEKSAVGNHDTKGDVQPKIEEVLAAKFKDTSSDIFFACATYRPETIYGVTNIFVNEDATYVIAEINGAKYYIAREAAAALSNQFGISIKGEAQGRELLQKRALNPVTNEEVPVLPGFFVKPDVGTGVVMSVPAHAPFDYVALERLKTGGYPVAPLPYKRVIEVKRQKGDKVAHPDMPALAHLEMLGAGPDALDDIIEIATKAIYKEESHNGVMLEGKYAGRPEAEARTSLHKDMVKDGNAFVMYTLANEEPVICRCGTRVIVKVVSDQWFINYGNREWKGEVASALPNIRVLPEKLRPTFEYLIEWLDLRATERAQGLGTPFPFNPSHMIESLSDSTIYMAFYTFVNILNDNKVGPSQLKPEFFDYIINSKGNADSVSASTKIDRAIIQKCKESFEYWYKNTSNHSGTDLLNNHFIMYIFNHIALFDKKNYPKQVVPNGLLLYEGQKMSKSIGNTMPVRTVIAKYGSDPVRFSSIATADLDSETNFEESTIVSVKQKNELILDAIQELEEMESVELEHIDYWLYSRLNSKIIGSTVAMDLIAFRSAYNDIFYNSIAELRWYNERGGRNGLVVREFLEKLTLMISPIMPHVAEEFWHALGKSSLVVREAWPVADKSMVNSEVEAVEETIRKTTEDIGKVMELTSKAPDNKGKKPKHIKIIVADDWKTDSYNALAEKKNLSAAISSAPQPDREKVSKFLSQFASKVMTLERIEPVKAATMFAALGQSKGYLSKRVGADIVVEMESQSKSQRASRAMPGKPSIEVVWQ